MGLCLAGALSYIGSAQEDRYVIDADGFEVEGNPATRRQKIASETLIGKRADEILLSCGAHKLLYVCQADTCGIDACTTANSDDVKLRNWSFQPNSAKATGFLPWLTAS